MRMRTEMKSNSASEVREDPLDLEVGSVSE